MTRKIKRIILFTVVLIIAFILLLSACGKKDEEKSKTENESMSQEQTKQKPPENLLKIETQIDNIIKDLGGPSVNTGEAGSQQGNQQQSTQQNGQQQSTQQNGQQQSTQQNGQQQSTQQGNQQQSSQQGGQQQSTQQNGQQQSTQQGNQQQSTQQGSQQQSTQQGNQQQSTQQGSQQQSSQQGNQQQSSQQGNQQQSSQQGGQNIDWTNINKLIDDLHYQWSEYMPEIAENSSTLIRTFSNNLNSLTTTSSERNMAKALYLANELYSSIPDFYSLYNSEVSPEVKRITYYVRKIIIESSNDWDQAIKDSEDLNNSWSLLKKTLSNEQNDAEKKLDFAIYEMKTVISQKSKQLTDIKGKIVLSNVQELEQTYKSKNKDENEK